MGFNGCGGGSPDASLGWTLHVESLDSLLHGCRCNSRCCRVLMLYTSPPLQVTQCVLERPVRIVAALANHLTCNDSVLFSSLRCLHTANKYAHLGDRSANCDLTSILQHVDVGAARYQYCTALSSMGSIYGTNYPKKRKEGHRHNRNTGCLETKAFDWPRCPDSSARVAVITTVAISHQ